MATIAQLLDPIRNAINAVAGNGVKGIERLDKLFDRIDAFAAMQEAERGTRGSLILRDHGATRRLTERNETNIMLQRGLGTVEIAYRTPIGTPTSDTVVPVLVVVVRRDKPTVTEAVAIATGDGLWAKLPPRIRSVADLRKHKIPVWHPVGARPVFKKGVTRDDLRTHPVLTTFTGTLLDGLPETYPCPQFAIEMPEELAEQAGLTETAIVMWPWPAVMRAHTILKVHKIIKEGIVDNLAALNYFMADVEKMIPDIGPSHGTTGKGELLYRYMAMILTGVHRASGVPVFPEAVRLFDPLDEHFLFADRIYPEDNFAFEDEDAGWTNPRTSSGRHNLLFKVNPADPSDVRFFDPGNPADPWPNDPVSLKPVDVNYHCPTCGAGAPLPRYAGKECPGGCGHIIRGDPVWWWVINEETQRWMVLDPRMDPMYLSQKYIWLMGWENPGNQQHFNQLRLYKLRFSNAFRRIATEQVIARVRAAMDRPGITAEMVNKDVVSAFDPTGKEKAAVYPTGLFTTSVPLDQLSATSFFDREEWERIYRFWLDVASGLWETECERDAANNLLTISIVNKAASASGWQWNHLTPAEKRAKMLRIFRLVYEMAERVDVAPAFGSETFFRTAAKKLLDEGLYLQLPEPEKSQKKGRLMVKADYCQMVMWAKGSVLNNARATSGHEDLLDKGFAFYPTAFMSRALQDRIHELITSFYEHDKVAVDKLLKLIARRKALGAGIPLGNSEVFEGEAGEMKKEIVSVIHSGCGVEGITAELEVLGVFVPLDNDGLRLMKTVEHAWRWRRLTELLIIEEVWRYCGIDVEQEGVSLTALWFRLVRANDVGIVAKMNAEHDEKRRANLEQSLFYTPLKAAFDEHGAGAVEEARKEIRNV